MGTILVWHQNQTFSKKCTTKHKNFWPGWKGRVSAAEFSFGSKAKMSQISPNIFQTFYQFSSRLSLTLQHIKNLDDTFFILANYHPFWLLTWSKIRNIDIFYKTQIKYFSKIIILALMIQVKIFDFWPCQKLKWVITCQNQKSVVQILYMLESKW